MQAAWRLRRPLEFYASLQLAPSRLLELASADAWLDRLGARDAFLAVRPRWRVERHNALPHEQESLWASKSQT